VTPALEVRLGPVRLATPLVAASGTFGSIREFLRVADVSVYGAVTAKSVAPEPWPGNPPPRLAPVGDGLLNAIGIQNPGIDAWVREMTAVIPTVPTSLWGSAVAHDVEGFATVASGLSRAGVAAVEVNLSCPNLEGGTMFALDPEATRAAVRAVREATDLPVGAKLSPDAGNLVEVAAAALDGGADWLVLTNTARGAAFDVLTGRPLLSTVTGGYSGPGLKPIALRCVYEVATALPGTPILGCGGVRSGEDVAEYLLAGAAAVAIGTAHFAEPRAGSRILREVRALVRRVGVDRVEDLGGTGGRS